MIDFVQPMAAQKQLAKVGFIILTAIYAVSLAYNPRGGDYLTVCGFKNLTGLPCPGCGLAHSFCALGKGDLMAAFSYNLLGPPLFIFLIFVWARCLFVLVDRSRPAQKLDALSMKLNPIRAFAIAFAVFGLARIIYTLLYHPSLAKQSPLMKLLARLIG
jgi:hypothetical protein